MKKAVGVHCLFEEYICTESEGQNVIKQNDKLRMLYVRRILLEQSDEYHALTAEEIAEQLTKYGLNAKEKDIREDIDVLREFGMEIVQKEGYYLASRQFEVAELKLLVDAVQASKFITSKKSDELIKKLEHLASRTDAAQLQQQVFIHSRPKAANETIYYNIDYLHTAISTDRKIAFQYAEWTMEKTLRPRKDGKEYIVSPWALTWDDENYYLIAYDGQVDLMKHYRVDKMQNMRLLDETREGESEFQDFYLPAFAKKTFGMYGGRDESVTLRCHRSLAGVILDRFGQDVRMVPEGEEYFSAKVLVAVSPQFYGWVTGIGSRMKITGPERVRREYRQYLDEIAHQYDK